jgi:predicted  nucleic acid-binding Zn-ribbon protein
MALKSRTRGWLDAASDSAVAALRAEVEQLAGDVAAMRAQHAESEVRQQQEMDLLRGGLAALADRLQAHTDRTYATADDLAELGRRITGNNEEAEQFEQLRLKLAGLAEQLRWESSDLRKGLAAIIERVERGRKTAR